MANTSGILSEATIAGMAAGLLDDYSVLSLDDDSPLGRVMAREFGTVRREILEDYPWSIARARAVLTELGTQPAFGFCAQYQLPSDCIRPYRLTVCGRTNGIPIPFKREGRKLLCDVRSSVKLVYIFDETNVGLWMALMARAFAGKLGMYASQNVTGKQGYFDKCRAAFNDAMFAAQRADALAEGTEETVIQPGYDNFDSVNVRDSIYGSDYSGVSYR